MLSGTWNSLWIQTWSESRMPPPLSSTSPTTWLVSLWRGTLSGTGGRTFSVSEYDSTFSNVAASHRNVRNVLSSPEIQLCSASSPEYDTSNGSRRLWTQVYGVLGNRKWSPATHKEDLLWFYSAAYHQWELLWTRTNFGHDSNDDDQSFSAAQSNV